MLQAYIVLIVLTTVVLLVILRTAILRKSGIVALRFGMMDKKDFLIVPLAFLLFYLVLANTFNWPLAGGSLFEDGIISWTGVFFCLCALALFAYALVSFGSSFRVGLDEDTPGSLITDKAFAISRNPIYTAFLILLAGLLCVFINWLFLLFWLGAFFLIRRQVRLEEKSLHKIYGKAYEQYCKKVRRFL